MKDSYIVISRILGYLGILVCAICGFARIAGLYHLAGFEVMTLFTGGIALIVAACYLKLEAP
ncbi:MAG: hypothetical protein ACWA5K_06595 [bacterium]